MQNLVWNYILFLKQSRREGKRSFFWTHIYGTLKQIVYPESLPEVWKIYLDTLCTKVLGILH